MIKSPKFAAYPQATRPLYARWFGVGATLLAVLSSLGALLRNTLEPESLGVIILGVMALWLLALLSRVLYYRFNHHNAQFYQQTSDGVCAAWWVRHRQQVALVESVLLGAGCSTPAQAAGLFSPEHRAPQPTPSPCGPTLYLPQLLTPPGVMREQRLASLLGAQWLAERSDTSAVHPLCCYWYGTQAGWQAFVDQVAQSEALIQLPHTPRAWVGMKSLDSIIDQLQDAPQGARILCGGCHTTSPDPDSPLPAGEAAALWLLGRHGDTRLFRGEGLEAGETLPSVGQRAMLQAALEARPEHCVSFHQREHPDIATLGWNAGQSLQDANFGDLGLFESVVAQTLAAWSAARLGKPVAWLAKDPHYSLALGMVETDEPRI